MTTDKFSDSITIGGETFDFDPEDSLALIPCENCGYLNAVDVTKEDDEYVPSSFSCENCGHWNSFD